MPHIFFMGGFISGIGKGIFASSIASIFKDCGLRVNIKKLDPYLNVDAGTINPFEHGETFITSDGLETDLDLGHYERFTHIKTTRNSIITSGKIYQTIISKERKGEYLGSTVQMIPHVSDEIIAFIKKQSETVDITLCEIGGTVGDIESIVYTEAIRQIKGSSPPNEVIVILLTYIPYLQITNEYKTKPVQEAVKTLLRAGIQPDMIVCRYEDKEITDPKIVQKISLFSNVPAQNIFLAPNIDNIYKLPYIYAKQGIHKQILASLRLSPPTDTLYNITKVYNTLSSLHGTIHIHAIIKYAYADAYISMEEALKHAAYSVGKNIQIHWTDVRNCSETDLLCKLQQTRAAILIMGGFGVAGVENKIRAIQYARENDIPCLGVCYGMQLMAIEYARNVLGIADATSEELDEARISSNHVVHIIDREETEMGATMRVGDYRGVIFPGSYAETIYNKQAFEERHRHRYEINTLYRENFEANGFLFSGVSADQKYMEISEVDALRFFIGVQFHPEFNTSIFQPNPVILEFVKHADQYGYEFAQAQS